MGGGGSGWPKKGRTVAVVVLAQSMTSGRGEEMHGNGG